MAAEIRLWSIREEKSYLEINLKETTLTGSANATALSLDAASTWNVTEDSRIAVLSVAPGAVIAADHPVTVTYGALEGALPAAENVTFVQDDQVKDDFEAKMMMPPPGGPGGPGRLSRYRSRDSLSVSTSVNHSRPPSLFSFSTSVTS